jgi:hypothetical protein
MPNSEAESLPTVVLLSVKLDSTVGFEEGWESEEEAMSMEESFESSSRLHIQSEEKGKATNI